MDESRTAEGVANGVEHLQGAARELIAAARDFLDVIEEMVDEPDRLSGSVDGLVDWVRDLAGTRPQPWESAAWASAGSDEPAAWEPDISDDAAPAWSLVEKSEKPHKDSRPARKTAPRKPRQRPAVKRISVEQSDVNDAPA